MNPLEGYLRVILSICSACLKYQMEEFYWFRKFKLCQASCQSQRWILWILWNAYENLRGIFYFLMSGTSPIWSFRHKCKINTWRGFSYFCLQDWRSSVLWSTLFSVTRCQYKTMEVWCLLGQRKTSNRTKPDPLWIYSQCTTSNTEHGKPEAQ